MCSDCGRSELAHPLGTGRRDRFIHERLLFGRLCAGSSWDLRRAAVESIGPLAAAADFRDS
jgi:hypothetical protein